MTTALKETGLPSTTDMVQAMLDGRKTNTRRLAGLHKINENLNSYAFIGLKDSLGYPASEDKLWAGFKHNDSVSPIYLKCPYGQVGDLLWTRETWYSTPDTRELLGYVADGDYPHGITYRVKPSIHMFKEYARIWSEITGIRVERLQEISEEDAKAEGCVAGSRHVVFGIIPEMDNQMVHVSARNRFKPLWDSINTKRGKWHTWKDDEEILHSKWVPIDYSWDTNPWVWVLIFKILSTTGRPT